MDKQSLEDSILFFAKKYDKEDVYINLFKTVPFPELVKMIIILMFDNKFDIYIPLLMKSFIIIKLYSFIVKN